MATSTGSADGAAAISENNTVHVGTFSRLSSNPMPRLWFCLLWADLSGEGTAGSKTVGPEQGARTQSNGQGLTWGEGSSFCRGNLFVLEKVIEGLD